MIQDGEINLRPVQAGDDDLLLRLYASTRAAELAHVPWTPEQKDMFVKMQFAAQKQHYGTTHPQADHQIICWKEQPAGRLYLDRTPDAFHILDITVLPELRSTGIGSIVLGEVGRSPTSMSSNSIAASVFSPVERCARRQSRVRNRNSFRLVDAGPVESPESWSVAGRVPAVGPVRGGHSEAQCD